MKRRIFAVLLALTLSMTAAAVPVYAAETGQEPVSEAEAVSAGCQIESTFYETLGEAFAAAKAGDTIFLCGDVDTLVSGLPEVPVTIDGGGIYTLGKGVMAAKGTDLTLQNLNITGSVLSYGSLTLENCTVMGQNKLLNTVAVTGGMLSVSGCTFSGTADAQVYANGCAGVTIEETQFAGTAARSHLWLLGCGEVTVQESGFTGLSASHLTASGCESLRLSRCTLGTSNETAVTVKECGYAEINRCAISGNQARPVCAVSCGSVKISRCTIGNVCGSAIRLQNNAAVNITGNEISGWTENALSDNSTRSVRLTITDNTFSEPAKGLSFVSVRAKTGSAVKTSGNDWNGLSDGDTPADGSKILDILLYNGEPDSWEQIGSKWYYFDADGHTLSGWQEMEDGWYWFAQDGAMGTGWKLLDGKWYYLKDNGQMATGWRKINGKWYYFKEYGPMNIGWQYVGGSWYYLGTDGAMVTGWRQINGKWYCFDEDGVMLYNTVMDGYILGPDGARQEMPAEEPQL